MHRVACSLLLVIGVIAGVSPGFAQQYPAKPIRFIVPFPPGGSTDFMSRLITRKMTDDLGWSIVVDNRPGAGGTIGVATAANAPADGYTLVLGETADLAVGPSLYSKLPYDPVKDLVPITLVGPPGPNVILVGAKSPYATFADLIAAAKAKPREITFASSGNGTTGHLAGELLQRVTGTQLVHVPYKGAGPATLDVIGGRAQFVFLSLESGLPYITSGQTRALAVTSRSRTKLLPNVPTVAESGFPGFETTVWFGVLAPKGTPAPIVQRLGTEIGRVVQLPEIRAKFGDGSDFKTGHDEFARIIKADFAKWAKVIKDAGVKID
jgi:tripartite-type tricarboxylate transporter receptor subunit TctC